MYIGVYRAGAPGVARDMPMELWHSTSAGTVAKEKECIFISFLISC